MKKIIVLFSIFAIFSCSDFEEENTQLCFPAFCGEAIDNRMNISLFNDTKLDIDTFYWEINNQSDSISPFPFNQFSCWINFNEEEIHHIYFSATVDGVQYELDSSAIDNSLQYGTGSFALEVKLDEDGDSLRQSLVNYDCKSLP